MSKPKYELTLSAAPCWSFSYATCQNGKLTIPAQGKKTLLHVGNMSQSLLVNAGIYFYSSVKL